MAELWINTVLATLVALFPIMNPFSTSVMFLAITKGDSPAKQKRQALMACVYAFCILGVFLLAGTLIMNFFGISIPGLRIAGGLMIARIGFKMLTPSEGTDDSDEALAEANSKADVAFTPIAMPGLSGPGSIAVTIGIASTVETPSVYPAILVGIFLVCLASWVVLRGATGVVRFLGQNGMEAMSRIMGFLLLCVGVQFIVNGIIGVVLEPSFLAKLAATPSSAPTP